jgi:hypothetical protein
LFIYCFLCAFEEHRRGSLITLTNELQTKLSTFNNMCPIGHFYIFSEFPTCEPLTQFVCKSGRCISNKWHCDSGKYQTFTVRHWFDWGPCSLAAWLPSKIVCNRSFQMQAKWLGQVVRGQLAHQWELVLRIMDFDICPMRQQ